MTGAGSCRTALCLGALVLLIPACGADPGDAAALLRGDRAFARGEYEEALAEYRLALLRENPGEDGVVRAAHAYVMLGRVDEARSLYEQAVAADDSYANQAVSDFVALARREHEAGDSYGMASAMEAALLFRPGIVVEGLALPMARHYSNSGEYARARPLYLRALGQNRDDADIVFETALAHEEIGDCERALVYFDQFGELAPRRTAEVSWHVGSCSFQVSRELAEEGALDEALLYLDAMIDLAEPRPLLAQAYMDKGELLAQLGDCLSAVEAFRAVRDADPSGSGPLVGQARARVDEIRFGERGDAPC